MKQILALLVIGCVALHVTAQTEPGRYLVGGSVDISSSYQDASNGHNIRGFNMAIAPSFGAFVVKGLAIGGRYSFGVSSSRTFNNSKGEYQTTTTFTSSIGPLIKYYLGKKQVKGLASVNAAYLTSVTLRSSGVSGTDGFNVTGLLGMAAFLNQHLAIETGLYLSATGYKKQFPTTRIGLSVGFFAFLDKKKKD